MAFIRFQILSITRFRRGSAGVPQRVPHGFRRGSAGVPKGFRRVAQGFRTHATRASAGGFALLGNNDQATELSSRLGWHKNAFSETTARPAAGLLSKNTPL